MDSQVQKQEGAFFSLLDSLRDAKSGALKHTQLVTNDARIDSPAATLPTSRRRERRISTPQTFAPTKRCVSLPVVEGTPSSPRRPSVAGPEGRRRQPSQARPSLSAQLDAELEHRPNLTVNISEVQVPVPAVCSPLKRRASRVSGGQHELPPLAPNCSARHRRKVHVLPSGSISAPGSRDSSNPSSRSPTPPSSQPPSARCEARWSQVSSATQARPKMSAGVAFRKREVRRLYALYEQERADNGGSAKKSQSEPMDGTHSSWRGKAFLDVLRACFPNADREELEQMVAWATPTIKLQPEGRKLQAAQLRELIGRCGYFDLYGGGYIEVDELVPALVKAGLDGAQARDTFARADTDGNGVLSLDEFVLLIESTDRHRSFKLFEALQQLIA